MSGKISFREKMNKYDKESLKVFAGNLWLHKVSQMRKTDLIEKIAETFLNPEKMFYRLSILDDEALDLLQSGSKKILKVSTDDKLFDTACTLNEMEMYLLGGEYVCLYTRGYHAQGDKF